MDVPGFYIGFVNALRSETGMADELLHVHAGLAVMFAVRIVTGRSLSTPLPWCFVVAAEVANEAFDRLHYGSWRWGDTVFDVANTLFWPTVLFLGLRLRKARSADAAPAAPAD